MPDVLIRDVPDHTSSLRSMRSCSGPVSPDWYLRPLSRERTDATAGVTVEDLARFAQTFVDLDDPEVMPNAWR